VKEGRAELVEWKSCIRDGTAGAKAVEVRALWGGEVWLSVWECEN